MKGFVDALFFFWFFFLVNVTYFVDQNTNNQCGIFEAMWPYTSDKFLPCIALQPFFWGN